MKTVLITGSSRGIGRETALYFAQKGWNVVIHGFQHPEQTASLEKEILSIGSRCLSWIGDISQPDFVSSMVEKSIAYFWQN